MQFDTKIAVVVRDDLVQWQKLNVTAFTVSGIAGTVKEVVGEEYIDATGNRYLPMLRQPVMIFAADREQIGKVHSRALRRGVRCSVYTAQLFNTGHDVENRAAVRAVAQESLDLVGIALYGDKGDVDKTVRGISLHQ